MVGPRLAVCCTALVNFCDVCSFFQAFQVQGPLLLCIQRVSVWTLGPSEQRDSSGYNVVSAHEQRYTEAAGTVSRESPKTEKRRSKQSPKKHLMSQWPDQLPC